ncbi:DinB family protein [Portibacter marinus]|uniref:DinB family protein n=1 Tax=Portibacter marinus TaxID=2898660 RepID=UPI001F422140|nr:DinB family protein [Portibacter marinus]
MNWKPDSKAWSIAQILDHIMTINESFFPILAKVKEGNYKVPWFGRIGFITNLMGNVVLKSVLPDTQKKITTFPIWEPSTSNLPGNILEKFAKHQEELKVMIEGAENLLEKDQVICSPANYKIVYKLEKAFEIIVAHEQRHLLQAKTRLEDLRVTQ